MGKDNICKKCFFYPIISNFIFRGEVVICDCQFFNRSMDSRNKNEGTMECKDIKTSKCDKK